MVHPHPPRPGIAARRLTGRNPLEDRPSPFEKIAVEPSGPAGFYLSSLL
jgi:hypothetical protein